MLRRTIFLKLVNKSSAEAAGVFPEKLFKAVDLMLS